jgi:hypothetical protein
VQNKYSEVPKDRCESSVQEKKKCSEHLKERGESSVQKKKRSSEQPKDCCETSVQKENKCSMQPQDRGANVSTPAHMDVTSASRQLTPMYGFQPMMPYLHPIIQPKNVPRVPPRYQIYGMNVGENSTSCFGLLQQVMKSADKKD